MAGVEPISDGMVSFIGGMDTSRSPVDLDDSQYSRAVNCIIPRSLGGIRARPGFVHQLITFEEQAAEDLFTYGHVQGEGWFVDKRTLYLIVVVDGVVFRLKRIGGSAFQAVAINLNNPNSSKTKDCYVIRIPDGVIVNNGVNLPLVVKAVIARRTDPSQGEIGIGRMGVYVQNRLFYVSQNRRRIYVSNFLNPIGQTEAKLFGLDGFAPPEDQDEITAIGKQKVMLNYAEGGALLFSTRINIYSIDVRGGMDGWVDTSTRTGKVSESINGIGAASPYSFESFGTNVYFRNHAFGISDLRQSQYQFANLDSIVSESIEASYWLDGDTDWMLDHCYSRSWRSRLFTTVSPEQDDKGRIFWNGILSYHPSAIYQDQAVAPRRYESVFTGIRPWAMTSVKMDGFQDDLYVWSHDIEGINRLYMLDDSVDFDINHRGEHVEIEGWIELRGMNFKSAFQLKTTQGRFYNLNEFKRSLNMKFYSRTESSGQWSRYWEITHRVKTVDLSKGYFIPRLFKPQTRTFVNPAGDNFQNCNMKGDAFVSIQDRIEFKGPLHLQNFVRVANPKAYDRTTTDQETESTGQEYSYLPDYSYLISRS